MDKSRIRDRQKDAKEFNPYPLFFVLVIGPKGVVDGAIVCSDANADQVVKIAIWQTFDIQIDWRAIEYLVRKVDGWPSLSHKPSDQIIDLAA
jgi:hypothetical protein